MQVSLSVRLIAVALLAIFALQAVFSLRQKSVTTDEVVYITAGYYHLRTGKFDYNRANPPFAKILTALPLLLLNPDLPIVEGNPAEWSEVAQWQYGRKFLYHNTVDADQILLLARLPIVVLALLLGFYTFRWAFDLYGQRAAVFALILFSFSPNVLAHSRFATQDLALVAFVFISAYYLLRFIEQPGWISLTKSAVPYSLAVITKTTAILLSIPAVFVVVMLLIIGKPLLASRWRVGPIDMLQNKRLQEALLFGAALFVFGIVTLFAINVGYGFEGSFVPLGDYGMVQGVASAMAAKVPFLSFLSDGLLSLPMPIPEPMIKMMEFQSSRIAGGNSIYFHGELSQQGWWYVIPVAFLIKSPIPVLILSAVSIFSVIRQRIIVTGELILLILAIFVFCLFSYLKSVSIGLRYILIIYPCLHVLASRLVRDGINLSRLQTSLLVLIFGWYVYGTIKIYPHYLAYFNEFVGGPKNGYKYLADSFVDWGQDLPALKAYMEKNGIDKIRLAYFGSGDANYYGIAYDYLPSVGLAPTQDGQKWWFEPGAKPETEFDVGSGPIAVSVTLLAGVFYPGYYASLRHMEPVDHLGYSILIFEP